MHGHVKAVGIIFMVFGCLGAFGGLVMLLFFGGLGGAAALSGEQDAGVAGGILGMLGGFLFFVTLLISLPSILAGWGLLKFKPWARILTIILAVLSLPGFPVGTLIGAYALWAMLNKDTAPLFQGAGATAPRI